LQDGGVFVIFCGRHWFKKEKMYVEEKSCVQS
jgi:hypothetical protein